MGEEGGEVVRYKEASAEQGAGREKAESVNWY